MPTPKPDPGPDPKLTEQFDKWYKERRAEEAKEERRKQPPKDAGELLERISEMLDERDHKLLSALFGDDEGGGPDDDTSRGRPPAEGDQGGLLRGLFGKAAG